MLSKTISRSLSLAPSWAPAHTRLSPQNQVRDNLGCAVAGGLARPPVAPLPALSRWGAAPLLWRVFAASLRSFGRLCWPAGGRWGPSVARSGYRPASRALPIPYIGFGRRL